MRELVERDAEPTPDRRRVVGDEHIGADDETMDDLLRLRTLEIQCQAAFVSIIDRPAVVLVADRHAGLEGHVAVGIPHAGRLDLDHVRTEVGHDRGCRRSSDEASRIEHFESGEDACLAHRSFLLEMPEAAPGRRCRPLRSASFLRIPPNSRGLWCGLIESPLRQSKPGSDVGERHAYARADADLAHELRRRERSVRGCQIADDAQRLVSVGAPFCVSRSTSSTR